MAKNLFTEVIFIIFKPMIGKKKWVVLLLLIAAVVFIRLLSSNTLFVEKYYSTGIYPFLSYALKYLFGWLPFSIGDLLYGGLIIWFLVKIVRLIKNVRKTKYNTLLLRAKTYPVIVTILLLYIVFNLFWGINYNRLGIRYQLGITLQKYSTDDLVTIDSILLWKVNESKAFLLRTNTKPATSSETFDAAQKAYETIALNYPFLRYQPKSIKSSLWGWAGNYIGFTGYYNPFTGEAQVNTTVPRFLQAYTSCHEIAHQLGYAKENEANFVGYLAASGSRDTSLHYSVYLDLFLYAQRNLGRMDSVMAKSFSGKLLPEVKADLREWKKFDEAHRSPLEPIFRWGYGKYLQSNRQPAGMLSYDEVTGFLIAYYKKFGRL